jgi:cell division protein FtsI/penicillin-binding protein 2
LKQHKAGDQIGKAGLERVYDAILRGTDVIAWSSSITINAK